MRHEIVMADLMRGREPRRIVWDDEAGTVEGDHSEAPRIARHMARPAPLVLRGGALPTFVLRDPARDAADFLALLGVCCPSAAEQESLSLPTALRGVRPTRAEPRAPLAPGEMN